MTEKQEYITKNGILFKWVDAYRKGGVYIACNQPYHYLALAISGDSDD